MPVDDGVYSGWCSLSSGVLPDMLSGIRNVRPRKTGISNPLSTNRMEHFLTADCKSAETPSGGWAYPALRNSNHHLIGILTGRRGDHLE